MDTRRDGNEKDRKKSTKARKKKDNCNTNNTNAKQPATAAVSTAPRAATPTQKGSFSLPPLPTITTTIAIKMARTDRSLSDVGIDDDCRNRHTRSLSPDQYSGSQLRRAKSQFNSQRTFEQVLDSVDGISQRGSYSRHKSYNDFEFEQFFRKSRGDWDRIRAFHRQQQQQQKQQHQQQQQQQQQQQRQGGKGQVGWKQHPPQQALVTTSEHGTVRTTSTTISSQSSASFSWE